MIKNSLKCPKSKCIHWHKLSVNTFGGIFECFKPCIREVIWLDTTIKLKDEYKKKEKKK